MTNEEMVAEEAREAVVKMLDAKMTELAQRCIVHPAYYDAEGYGSDEKLRVALRERGAFLPQYDQHTKADAWTLGYMAASKYWDHRTAKWVSMPVQPYPVEFSLKLRTGDQTVVCPGGAPVLEAMMLDAFPLILEMSEIEFRLRRSAHLKIREPENVPMLLELLECAARGDVGVQSLGATVIRVEALARDAIQEQGLFVQPKADLAFAGKYLKTFYRNLADQSDPYFAEEWDLFLSQPGMPELQAKLQKVWDDIPAAAMATKVKGKASIARKDKVAFSRALANCLLPMWPKGMDLPEEQPFFDWISSNPTLNDEIKLCGQEYQGKAAPWIPTAAHKDHQGITRVNVPREVSDCFRELIKVANRHQHKMENLTVDEITAAFNLVRVGEVMES